MYLVNEIAQKEKARGKEEFSKAFSPLIADGVVEAYSGAGVDVKNKLKRVVSVWRERNVFSAEVQDDVEKRISDLDKGKAAKGKLGGSLFASADEATGGTPAELKEITDLHTHLRKSALESDATTQHATESYLTTWVSLVATPAPPVEAARINALLKTLSTAHSTLQTTLAARDSLLASLEKTVNEHRLAREKEETALRSLESQRATFDERKTLVDEAIMKGLAPEPLPLPDDIRRQHDALHAQKGGDELPRPEMEPLTPPAADTLTPPLAPEPASLPSAALDGVLDDGARTPPGTPPMSVTPVPHYAVGDPRRKGSPPDAAPTPLPGLATGLKRPGDADAGDAHAGLDPRRKSSETMTFKRRKTEDAGVDGMGELDADVVGDLG